VVGHIPFLSRDGILYPWSKLNPGQVHLSVAVMPDCQHLLEKDLITAPPPDQGPVLTVFAPRSFRYLRNNRNNRNNRNIKQAGLSRATLEIFSWISYKFPLGTLK
jgi:hypothetical protein